MSRPNSAGRRRSSTSWPAAIRNTWARSSTTSPTNSAFELLKWRSQETNAKLRALAEQIARDFLELHYHEDLPPRSAYDRLLLTAHHRVPS
jgi:hypothetical protein